MDAYELLKREIRQYIYNEGWESLKSIQTASIKQVQKTENNLILAAPTASGKTEAAFLPAINSVKDWNSGVKVIYISPLIALINDQFKRVYDLCEYMGIGVTSWHGEASASKKKKLLKDPKGILLITPESIEAMLCLRPNEAKELFKETEWIIVDEIHSFLGNNRGVQLRSLIGRINAYMGKKTRCIGMSATLNRENYKNIKEFFINDRITNVLLDSKKNELEVSISYYKPDLLNESKEDLEEIYNYSQKESMLVFPNSKSEVERISVNLSRLAKKRKSYANYFAHHASISKEIKDSVEKFAKNNKKELFTICCTSTLELGIDIGSVDSIVQYNAPYSVSSLAQRLGRSGRSTGKSILHFIATNEWSLLQGLAIIELYIDGKIDRVDEVVKPYDVLAHQVISILLEKNGMSIPELKNINKNFNCWQNIEDQEYSELIDHLVKNNYIEILENEVITGRATEKLLRQSDFFAHFDIADEFSVYNSQRKIGQIPLTLETKVGTSIALGGGIWKIKDIQEKGKRIYVTSTTNGEVANFLGRGASVSDDIRNKMKEILEDKEGWKKYNKEIKEVLLSLSENNLKYEKLQWIEKNNKIGLRTFKGSRINRSLQLLLNMSNNKDTELYTLKDNESFIEGPNIKKDIEIIIKENFSKEDIYNYLKKNPEIVEMYLMTNKYRQLLPENLKIKYVMDNKIDLEGVRNYLDIKDEKL